MLIKKEFDFGWKKWLDPPFYADLAHNHQKGDILDVGCATCELYTFLKGKGWTGKYYGIDAVEYINYKYPPDVNLIIGKASEVEFPEVDTVILYNLLEHLDDPVNILAKSLKSTRDNVLINIPKRNEEMWVKYGLFEPHQLDKTHKHCGFSREDCYNMVDLAGGEIKIYHEVGEINALKGMPLWNNVIPRGINLLMSKIFSSKTYYHDIWCEIVPLK
nr:class I SAM-dependent methyltransferase [uncultured Methanobacterium sp.]